MKLYIIDAFAEKLFTGNPAAVCPLEEWLPDVIMQQIAFENNLAETAFVVKKTEGYHIRWFTPKVEVDLCGHATLAAAHALFFHEGNHDEKIRFDSRSGNLTVARNGDWLSLDFPMDEIAPMDISESLSGCFSCMPEEIYKGKTDYMFVYKKQKDIEQIIPDYEKISGLDARGVIITAPGDNSDFVSRFFAPLCGINEDPVTGSAHTTLAPYWANRLNKRALSARQVSSRGGNLRCEIMGDRVTISGAAVTYLIGDVQLNKS